MAVKYTTAEVNNFIKGLITEASPLTFPDGASLDEVNFVLNRDGTRNRRLGMEEEDVDATTSNYSSTDQTALINTYNWEYAGNNADVSLLVVQDDTDLLFYDLTQDTIGDNLLVTLSDVIDTGVIASFANVDGYLVVADGSGDLIYVKYDSGTITYDTYRLKIRDLFGVDDDYYDDLTERPDTLTEYHTYNLRNQTFAVPRKKGNAETIGDTIDYFYTTAGVYPSNSDTVNSALYSDVNDSDDRVGRRFFADALEANPLGTMLAPQGYFILDALNRGQSRLDGYNELLSNYSSLGNSISALPADQTPGGASIVAEYAGRMFYAGFSGATVDGDDRSPKLPSYILFSQLIQGETELSKCHQAADPTNPDDADLVDTDGGFLRISEAKNIRKMVSLGTKLVILAENGIWTISGGSDYGFTASNYLVTKITDKGVLSPQSIATVGQTLYYWAEDAIYSVGPNDLGDFVASNITRTTIQTFYNDIEYLDKKYCSGNYDSYEQRIHWVYADDKELVLDITLSAFYKNEIQGDGTKNVRAVFKTPSYRAVSETETVTANGVTVTANGETVTIPVVTTNSRYSELKYAVFSTGDTENTISFASYSNSGFLDWGSYDAEAYLITGYVAGSDFQRKKYLPYLTLHFLKTETGLDENYDLVNPGGCLVRVVWEWSDSTNSNRWGKQFEAYRFRRHYFPSTTDSFENGFETVVTKNKIRGYGKVLSIHFNTEEGKDCNILGWSLVLGMAGNV